MIQKKINNRCRRAKLDQNHLLSGHTVKILEPCRRQDEINLVMVTEAYVSQRGFIWKQRCGCIPRRVHRYSNLLVSNVKLSTYKSNKAQKVEKKFQ